MAKARKSNKSKAKTTKAKTKAKTAKRGTKAKPAKRKAKARRRAKPSSGPIATAIEAVEESAALRRRLAGRNTFED